VARPPAEPGLRVPQQQIRILLGCLRHQRPAGAPAALLQLPAVDPRKCPPAPRLACACHRSAGAAAARKANVPPQRREGVTEVRCARQMGGHASADVQRNKTAVLAGPALFDHRSLCSSLDDLLRFRFGLKNAASGALALGRRRENPKIR